MLSKIVWDISDLHYIPFVAESTAWVPRCPTAPKCRRNDWAGVGWPYTQNVVITSIIITVWSIVQLLSVTSTPNLAHPVMRPLKFNSPQSNKAINVKVHLFMYFLGIAGNS